MKYVIKFSNNFYIVTADVHGAISSDIYSKETPKKSTSISPETTRNTSEELPLLTGADDLDDVKIDIPEQQITDISGNVYILYLTTSFER